MRFSDDPKGRRYVEWEIASGTNALKRAWVEHRTGRWDWAETGRYLLVARMGRSVVQPIEFPIYYPAVDMNDDQVLAAFVRAVSLALGCPVPEGEGDAAAHT